MLAHISKSEVAVPAASIRNSRGGAYLTGHACPESKLSCPDERRLVSSKCRPSHIMPSRHQFRS